jgi:MFS family permease
LKEQNAAAPGAAPATPPYPSSGKAWYLVFVLLIFYIFSFIDRQIMSLMVQPIRRDFGLTLTQVGLLQGPAFAILYTLAGVPIGRLADTMNRKSIIALGSIIWSFMAALCGVARTAVQLFMARIGVGIGEAALSPSAYSMLTDAFPREKQGRAFSIYNMGISIGSGVALLVGGIVYGAVAEPGKTFTLPVFGEVRAWQFAFIVTGAPGLLLPLLLLSVREPLRRGLIRGADGVAQARIPLRDVFAYIWQNRRFYRLHFVALGMLSVLGYAVGAWLPEVMRVTYGVDTASFGKYLGISTICVNTLGIFIAGRICDRLTAQGRTDAAIWVCFGAAIGIVLTSSFAPFMPTILLSYIAISLGGLPFHGYVAMGPMAVKQVTPNQMRAQVSAVYLFIVNLLGQVVGPVAVPFITEYILRDESQIRWGLSIVVMVSGLISATLLWRVRPVYREKIAAAAQWR